MKVTLAAATQAQVQLLAEHYARQSRPAAMDNLAAAIDRARSIIAAAPERGLPAPRPYPQLARTGRAWIKVGRYWFAYRVAVPPVIVAIFFETADIPSRVSVMDALP